MGSAEELTVVVGAPLGDGSLPKAGLLLIVEADLEKARQLGQELAWDARVMVCSEVLTTEEGAPVRWHRFNDARLNGPAALDAWKEQYPNLQLVGEEQRRGRCLEGVVNAWAEQQGLQGQPWLHLEVRQGDPMAAVGGLGPWLAGLQSVHLDISKTAVQWHQPLDAWLRERGLLGVEDVPGSWRRDPVATLQLSLQEKERLMAELEEQLSTQAVRLLLAQTSHQELAAERDELMGVRDQLKGERDGLAVERDGLVAERAGVIAERDQLKGERDGLAAERDGLVAEKTGVIAERDQLKGERDGLAVERDGLVAEKAGVIAERDLVLMRKVFCIGDSRTGTTSFHEHAIQLGFTSIHHYEFIFGESGLCKASSSRDELYSCLKNFIDNAPYICFSDYPTREFFEELSIDYPDSLFINTTRSQESWIRSCRKYFTSAGLDINYEKLLSDHLSTEAEIRRHFDSVAASNYLDINICEGDIKSVSADLNSFLGFADSDVIIGHQNKSATSCFSGLVHESIDTTLSGKCVSRINLKRPSEQFSLYSFSVDSLDELINSLCRRPFKAVLSEHGHAFLINDSTEGIKKLLTGGTSNFSSAIRHFLRKKEYLNSRNCSYTLFIVPEKISLCHGKLPSIFEPYAKQIESNLREKRLAALLSSELDFCYDTFPYLSDIDSMGSIVHRFDSHLNGFGGYHLVCYIEEILSLTTCPALRPISKSSDWSARIGTWRGDLLAHLSKEEINLINYAWKRNSMPLHLPGNQGPSEQFIEYFIKTEGLLDVGIDYGLQALHKDRKQYIYKQRLIANELPNAFFLHDSAIDRVYAPLASMFNESNFYWHKHLLPPGNHQSLSQSTNFIEIYQERFLYSL